MALAEWLTSFFLLPTILVPALPPQPKEGWTGEVVLVRKSGTQYTSKGDKVEGAAEGAIQYLRSIEYRVLKDSGDKLLVFEQSHEVWVKKEDMVLLADAVAFFTTEAERNPKDARPMAFRGWANARRGNTEQALKDYGDAIQLAPNVPDWHNNRGVIYSNRKEYDKAIADFDEALKLNPNSALAYRNRAHARSQKKDYPGAVADYERSIQLLPNVAFSHNGLAWLLATCPEAKHRDGKRAVEAAKKACELSNWKSGSYIDTLAAAYAEAGDFDEAVKWQDKALSMGDFPKEELAEGKKRLQMFKEKKPYRLEEK